MVLAMGCASPAPPPAATSAPYIAFALDLKIEPREAATFLLNPSPIGKAGYSQGMTVTIDILPKQGWQLDKWVGPVINIDETTSQIEMNSSQSVAVLLKSTTPPTPMPTDTPIPATKTPIPPTRTPTPTPTPTPVPPKTFTLTTSAYPSTGGRVSGGGSYLRGTSATVTATLKKGYDFSGWSGVCSGTGRCVVTMNRNKSVTANFVRRAAAPTPFIFRYATATPVPDFNPFWLATATPIPRPSYPSNRIASLNATVENVRFYEGDREGLDEIEDREYNGFFKSDEARYINWELHLNYPEHYSEIAFVVHWQLFKGRERLTRQDTEASISASWTGSYHSKGWGRNTPGSWDAGFYEIDFYVEGEFVARGSFEIYD